MGFDRPASETAKQRLAERQRQQEAAKQKAKPKPRGGDDKRAKDDGAPPPQADGDKGAERPKQRPTRSSLQGERAPGAAGGVRRVVIDSQASRRGPGGPAAVPAAVRAADPAWARGARRGAAAAGAAAPTWSRRRRTSPR